MFGQDADERRQDVSGNATHGGAYPPGGHGLEDEDLSPAAEHATRHAGADADPSLFTTILGALSQKRQSLKDEDVDEEDAVKQHKKHYQDADENETDGKSIGAAAAMQALKRFTSGGSDGSGNSQETNSQSAFIGMAMAEAAKLFDQKASAGKIQGNESKDSAVMEAAQMALKFYMKGKGGDQTSSGAGGLLSMAAKFM